jgi:glyoxylase-like metal-dependent hydrolase (beta-lactamase superfamily II)
MFCPKTKKAWIIDAPKDSFTKIKHDVEILGLHVENIVLTHSHWDHIADLKLFQSHFRCPVLVHKEDADNVIAPGADGLSLYFPIDPVTPDGYLMDGQLLSLSDSTAKIIHTPGHSHGSICLYFHDEKILVSGDTLFKGSMGRVDLPTSDPEMMWLSLEKLSLLPADVDVYPGHGPSTTIGSERWTKDAKKLFS